MRYTQQLAIAIFFSCLAILPQTASAKAVSHVNARSAVLVNMETGSVLFEQNADLLIPPASITKVLTLYLVFESIKEGRVHLSDQVEISKRAAGTGGSRMGLRAGTRVSLEELIKGMAVVSGNDACVAIAEHISGNVDRFVKRMNAKARELGMNNSRFMTPNGLPAAGQVTTARDIAKLSIAYLRRYPESLAIHSMQSYTYKTSTHHNANRLLGRCPGVDGLKTGFVCASGYNITATARRGDLRLLAVVMGARSAGIRLLETERLLEAGFRECGGPSNESRYASGSGRTGRLGMSCNAPSLEKTGTAALRARNIKGRIVVSNRVAPAGKRTASAKSEPRQSKKQQVIYATVTATKTRAETSGSSKGKSVKAKETAATKSAALKSAKTRDKKDSASVKKASSGKSCAKTATAAKHTKSTDKKASTQGKASKRAHDYSKKPKG